MNPTQEQVDYELAQAAREELKRFDRAFGMFVLGVLCAVLVGIVALRMAGWR